MSRSSHHLLALFAVIAAAALWGSTGTVQALLPETREPLVVASIRLIVGALALLVLALVTGGRDAGFHRLRPGGVLLAGISIGLYNLLFFAAVQSAGVGVGTAIAIGSAPIWVSAYDLLVRGEAPRGLRLLGQTLSIAGACLLVFSGSALGASWQGMVQAALAGGCYAAYSIATARMGNGAPPATTAAATFCVAALITAPVLLMLPLRWAATPEAMLLLLGLGVLATGLAYVLYTWGLRHMAAARAVTLALVEPLTAWLLATVILGEPVTAAKFTGAALLLLGLVLVTRRRAG